MFTVCHLSGEFVFDHVDRAPEGEPVEVIRRNKGGSVDVTGTRKQFEALHDDAVFYADARNFDPDGGAWRAGTLRASARRIVARLAALGFDVKHREE